MDESLLRSGSSWIPDNGRNRDMDVALDFLKAQPLLPKKNSKSYNVSLSERKALTSLRENQNIIIKEADKGSAIVLMDREYYEAKVHDILEDTSTYRLIPQAIDLTVHNKIKKLTQTFSSELTVAEIDYVTKFEYKTSQFYGLPKIHKSEIIINAIKEQNSDTVSIKNPSDLKLRPIVAGPACPTHKLSHLLDLLLQPYLVHIESYVRDDIDFLNKIPSKVSQSEIFVTFDVVSLYSSIEMEFGLEALKYWTNAYPSYNDRFSKQFIIEAAKLVLTQNTFQFDSRNYVQILGTAMGTKFAPSYASLTLGYLEIIFYGKVKEKYNVNVLQKLKQNYKRYLDDIFCVWDTNDGDISEVKNMLNSINDKICFTLDQKGNNVTFLDVRVMGIDGLVKTDIFHKVTDTKQYLDFRSNHPRHIKNNIPFNLARRICTIITDPELRQLRLSELKSYLLDCHYPEGIIKEGTKKALLIPLDKLRTSQHVEDQQNTIPFISTFNPNFNDQFEHIQQTVNYLKVNPNTSNIFKDLNVIKSKRQPSSLKNILTRARFNCNDKLFSVTKCNDKRCKLCNILIEGSTFKFEKTNFVFKVNANMSCSSLNCIYVLVCCGCSSIYIGETVNLRLRINLHRDHIGKNTGLNVSKHIAQCTGQLENKFSIMPFFKVQKDDVNIRKRKEAHFIAKFCPELNRL
jgi:hypothetical protein